MRPHSVPVSDYRFQLDFAKEMLQTGRIKDLHVLFREISLFDFSRMTGIPQAHLVGRNVNWTAMKGSDRECLMEAFGLSEQQVEDILTETKSSND